jgi:hypothetical protein
MYKSSYNYANIGIIEDFLPQKGIKVQLPTPIGDLIGQSSDPLNSLSRWDLYHHDGI